MELCRELVPYGAFYETHMRDEGEHVVEAVREALEICERSGAPLQIAHHKVTRKSVWQVHCKTTIALVDQARRRGLDVKLDQYPYSASATSLDSNAPLWAFEGGVERLVPILRSDCACTSGPALTPSPTPATQAAGGTSTSPMYPRRRTSGLWVNPSWRLPGFGAWTPPTPASI